MLIQQHDEDFVKAVKLLARTDVGEIRLAASQTEMGDPESLKSPYTLEMEPSPGARPIGVKEGCLFSESFFQITSKDSSDEPKLVFRVQCSFRIRYDFDEVSYVPQEDEVIAFTKAYVIFHTWPYAREFTQSLCQRMGFNPPPLPLLRLSPPTKSKPDRTSVTPKGRSKKQHIASAKGT